MVGQGIYGMDKRDKSATLFVGHYQPHLPSDLGFYDLRVRETGDEQVQLAKSYGIDGFCYCHYWFSGKRLLNFRLTICSKKTRQARRLFA